MKDAIEDFRARTNTHDEAQLAQSMGKLAAQGMDPLMFRALCNGFADGMEYVQENYGMAPNAIVLTDEKRQSPYYNAKEETVFVPLDFIAHLAGLGYSKQSKTEPYALNPDQAAFAYGVEEAAHHYTVKTEGFGVLKGTRYQPGHPRYDEQPIERKAKDIVREAMKEKGYDGFHVASLTFATDKNSRFTR